MISIARIVAVGAEDVVVVGEKPHPKFTPSRVGRFFVRLVDHRDVHESDGSWRFYRDGSVGLLVP